MSTEIKHNVTGRYEIIENSATYTPAYKPAEVHLTRFYGGKKSGTMLQLTIQTDQTSCIQLTQEEVKKLIKVLSESFDYDKHPSE